ncbi:MAG: beta-propeller fold lactonase family protein, partial [Thermoplasmataceae archaeon]
LGISIDTTNHFVFVGNASANTIQSFSYNTSTGDLTSIGSVATGGDPWGVAVDPVNHFVFVSNTGTNEIQSLSYDHNTGVLNFIGSTSAASTPFGIAVDSENNIVFAGWDGDIASYVYNPITGNLVITGTLATTTNGEGLGVDIADNLVFGGGNDLMESFTYNASVNLNISAPVTDGYDTYTITYVSPPVIQVAMSITWNTTLLNFTSASLVNQLASTAIMNYVNAIQVAQPLNLLDVISIFQTSVAAILPTSALSALNISVYLNGSSTPTLPTTGTSIIPPIIPEGYWYASSTSISVSQL